MSYSGTLRPCAQCGGVGVGLVKASGLCDHCTRTGGAASAAASFVGAGAGAGAGKKRARVAEEEVATAAAGGDVVPSAAELQRLLAEADRADVPTLDANGVKQLLHQLERRITRNSQLRAKHADDPSKFIESEAELDAELKGLRVLAAAPEQYGVLLRSNCLKSLLELLAHENSDVAIDVVLLLAELLSEEALAVVVGGGSEEGEGVGVGAAAGAALTAALEEAGALELLVENAERLDRSGTDDDRAGVFATLQLLLAMLEASDRPARLAAALFAVAIPAPSTTLSTSSSAPPPASGPPRIAALLLRKLCASKGSFDEVKGAAAELLAVLVASVDSAPPGVAAGRDVAVNNALRLGRARFALQQSRGGGGGGGALQTYHIDGVEYLLEAASAYKKRQPASKEEEECAESVFEALSAALQLGGRENADRFRGAEGFELMLRIVHDNGFARFAALRAIASALACGSAEACTVFVAAGGLKAIFPAFMGRGLAQTRRAHGAEAADKEDEYAVAAIASCLQLLPEAPLPPRAGAAPAAPAPGAGLERLRLLAKFKETFARGGPCEKLDRLVELHVTYLARVVRAGAEADSTAAEDEEAAAEAKEEAEAAAARGEAVDEVAAASAREERAALAGEQRYLLRLRAGLFTLQRVDFIIAALATSSDSELASSVRAKLYEQRGSLLQVSEVLVEYLERLVEPGRAADNEREGLAQLLAQLEAAAGRGERERGVGESEGGGGEGGTAAH